MKPVQQQAAVRGKAVSRVEKIEAVKGSAINGQ